MFQIQNKIKFNFSLFKLFILTTVSFFIVSCNSEKGSEGGGVISKISFSLPTSPNSVSLVSPSSSPGLDPNPTFRVEGVIPGSTVKIFTDSSCTNEIGSALASDSSVEVKVSSTLPEASYQIYAHSINSHGPSSCSLSSVSYEVVSCPEGYVPVPHNSTLDVAKDFCVMKYEAKLDSASQLPMSTGTGTPWVEISAQEAFNKCHALNSESSLVDRENDLDNNGTYSLISNPEWMVIARNIESNPQNWSGANGVGDGMLNRGHSDGDPGHLLEVSNSNDPFDGTGNDGTQSSGLGGEQKRTHVLSNGETIWDLAGNAYEWVDWLIGGDFDLGPSSCTQGWSEIPIVSCEALKESDYLPGNPASIAAGDYDSSYGMGKFIASWGGKSGGAAHRGHNYLGTSANAGIFTLNLYHYDDEPMSHISYRCVYRP